MDGCPSNSTNPRGLQVADKSLRSCAENSVIISAMMLSEDSHRRIVGCFLAGLSILRKWTGRCLKEVRSADGNEAWFQAEANGRCMEHISEIVAQLANPQVLEQLGFLRTSEKASSEDFLEHITDDEVADYLGQILLSLAFARLKRMLWLLCGWPWAMIGVLGGPSQREKLMARFKEDVAVWEAFQAFDAPQAVHRRLQKRHCFQTVSCQQLICVAKDTRPTRNDELVSLMKRRARCAVPTKAVEAAVWHKRGHTELLGNLGVAFVYPPPIQQ